jgi:hypothetical protein
VAWIWNNRLAEPRLAGRRFLRPHGQSRGPGLARRRDRSRARAVFRTDLNWLFRTAELRAGLEGHSISPFEPAACSCEQKIAKRNRDYVEPKPPTS